MAENKQPARDPRLREFHNDTLAVEMRARSKCSVFCAIMDERERIFIKGAPVEIAALLGILSDELKNIDETAYFAFFEALSRKIKEETT